MIYLPPSYGSGENRYPVLYVHDLGDLFDPAYSNSLRSIEKLFSSQEVPELLLVGVAPKDRKANTRLFPSGICCRINGSTAGRATNMPLFWPIGSSLISTGTTEQIRAVNKQESSESRSEG